MIRTKPLKVMTMDGDTALPSEMMRFASPTPSLFSGVGTRASSPPLSPPGFPWERQDSSNANAQTQGSAQSAFSLLGKKRKALDSVDDNARKPRKVFWASKPKKPSLTQMQLSLGQEVQKKCESCGMEYVPSSAEDRKVHSKYHKNITEGYDLGPNFIRDTREPNTFAGANPPSFYAKGPPPGVMIHINHPNPGIICAIDRWDNKPNRKKQAQAVLDIVQQDLGAVDIPQEELWSPRCPAGADFPSTESMYAAYLYIVYKSKCVGFLLVKRIKEAHRVMEPPTPVNADEMTPSTGALATLRARHQHTAEQLAQPLTLSEETYPVRLGISRIWVSASHRKQHIATALLDAAVQGFNERAQDHIDGREATEKGQPDWSAEEIDKKFPERKIYDRAEVAFSQPTEAGIRLARRWFGRDWGWGVYSD